MDNASKALIMAGAILIAVALVGVGVYLYQSASGTISSGVDQLSAADMETKNAAIQQFEGTSVSGSDVKTLIRRIQAYNEADIFPEDIKINNADANNASASNYTNNKKYSVSLTYSNGYVSNVQIGG